MDEQDPCECGVHEEPLDRRLDLDEVSVLDVAIDDAGVVSPVPRGWRRVGEELGPPPDGRPTRRTGHIRENKIGFPRVPQQSGVH